MITISNVSETKSSEIRYYFAVRHIPTGLYLSWYESPKKEPSWYLLTIQNKTLSKKYLLNMLNNRVTKAYNQILHTSCCSCGSCEPTVNSAEVCLGMDEYTQIYLSGLLNDELIKVTKDHIESLNLTDVEEVRLIKPLSDLVTTSKYELDFDFKRVDVSIRDIV